jgi:hypothetical protein
MYEFEDLTITYNPSCPSTTDGIMAMAFDIDSTDRPPESFAETLQIAGAVSFAPWSAGQISIPKEYLARRTNAKFIETDATAEVDLNKALATFYFVSSGGTAEPDEEVQVGYLSINYRVSLMMPQLHEAVPGFLHCWTNMLAVTPGLWNGGTWDAGNYHHGSASTLLDRGWRVTDNSDPTASTGLTITVPGVLRANKSETTYLVQRSMFADDRMGVDSPIPTTTGDVKLVSYFHRSPTNPTVSQPMLLSGYVRSGWNGGDYAGDYHQYSIQKMLLITVGEKGGTVTINNPAFLTTDVVGGEILVMEMPRNWFSPLTRSALTEVRHAKSSHPYLLDQKFTPAQLCADITDDEDEKGHAQSTPRV